MTPEELEAAEGFAALQFTREELAKLMQVDVGELELEPLCSAIARGRLRGEAEVRQAMLRLAKQGSTPAQNSFMELVRLRRGRDGGR